MSLSASPVTPALPRFTFPERSGSGAVPVDSRAGQGARVSLDAIQRDVRHGAVDPAKIPSTTTTVQPSETLESIAETYGTTVGQLAQLNPDIRDLNDIQAGQTINVPANRQVVQVQEGDTLASIAERYGVDEQQLADANGIADPNAIQVGQRIAIVPRTQVGLDRDGEVQAYIADMQALQQDWPNLTPDQRLERITDALNERLEAAGVPPVRLTVSGSGGGGVYDFSTHSIEVSSDLLNQPNISTGDLQGLANTVYHEGRHAEQWFDMARLQVARGEDPSNMGLPQSVIDAARAAPPLDPESQEGRFVASMYESVYGAGGADRNDVLGKLNNGDYSVYELYRALPEEADAWRVGGKVENLWPRS